MAILTFEQDQVITTIGLISTTSSIVGCIIVMITFLVFPKQLQTMRNRLVLNLTFADFGLSGAIFSGLVWFKQSSEGDVIPSGLCKTTGFIMQTSMVSEDLWVVTISLYLYCGIVKNIDLEAFEWVFHLICWGVPLVVAIIPFWAGTYELAGTWCWIGNAIDRLYFGYVSAWIAILTIFTVYSLITYHIFRASNNAEKYMEKKNATNRKILKQLTAFPIIYLIQYALPSVNRIQNVVAPHNQIPTLYAFTVFFLTISGAVNCIFYNRKNGKKLLRKLRPAMFFSSTSATSPSIKGSEMTLSTSGHIAPLSEPIEEKDFSNSETDEEENKTSEVTIEVKRDQEVTVERKQDQEITVEGKQDQEELKGKSESKENPNNLDP